MAQNTIIPAVCGNENIEVVFSKVDITLSSDTDLHLNEQQEEFFKKEHPQSKKYPSCAKLLALLRVAHSGVSALLDAVSKNIRTNCDGKTTEKSQKEIASLLNKMRKIFREIWNTAEDTKLRHLLKRFIHFTNGVKIAVGLVELLMCCLVLLKELLVIFINLLENANEKELQIYETWLTTAATLLSSVLKSDVFRGVAATAASAGFFVVGFNLGLSALGFTAAGIQGGSIAAAWMSSIGTVQAGSLFAGLQSAGVIGFGFVATGGIAAVGAALGLVGFGIFKAVTRNRSVEVYIERQGILDPTPTIVKFKYDTSCNNLLLRYIPVDIVIPEEVDAIGVDLYLANDKRREKIQFNSLMKNKKLTDATDVLSPGLSQFSLVLFKAEPTMTNTQLPFYLQRNGPDLWTIVQNKRTAPW